MKPRQEVKTIGNYRRVTDKYVFFTYKDINNRLCAFSVLNDDSDTQYMKMCHASQLMAQKVAEVKKEKEKQEEDRKMNSRVAPMPQSMEKVIPIEDLASPPPSPKGCCP